MSRDAFPHDPRDTSEARGMSTRRTAPQQRSTPVGTRDNDNRPPEAQSHRNNTETRQQLAARDERNDSPRAYTVTERSYLLRDSEVNTLKEIGVFRVIPVADLAKFAYRGNYERLQKDIRSLARQSLVRDIALEISRRKTLRVVILTKTGHGLLKTTNQVPNDQPTYHGLRKPREVKHDADLYRLYQKEAGRIERGGGRPIRVLLDYELKRNLNRDLALLGPERENPERKRAVAEKHHLQVVNGKIPVPDLRVEYEDREFELRRVDLELATRDYRPRAMAEKASAGFSLYSRPEDASRLRRVLDEREITAGILTL